MAAHRDFGKEGLIPTTTPAYITPAISAWLSKNITYGLYLSDHSILDGIDTEIVVLAGIMVQNLERESGWHLRGMRRVGVGFEETERVRGCVSVFFFFLVLLFLAFCFFGKGSGRGRRQGGGEWLGGEANEMDRRTD